MNFTKQFLIETENICRNLNIEQIDFAIETLKNLKLNGGRLFILGCGGSAGHASHAVNDFRKICGIEAYCPTDNVSELTARVNDEGWDTVFSEWLKISKFKKTDCLLIFSVGGGNEEKQVSVNLIKALKLSAELGAQSICVVGKPDGYSAKNCNAPIIVPIDNANHTTPHAEAFAAVIWHLIVTHPDLKVSQTKWESIT